LTALEQSTRALTRSVAEYMSPAPPFVEADEPLWNAERIMRSFGLNQLPVVAKGELCGVLTARDTRAKVSTKGSDRSLTVSEAMSTDFYVVRPSTPLVHVLRTMASHDYLCTLVVDDERIQGILTSAHALEAAAQLLDRDRTASATLDSDEIRAVLLAEHAHVRMLLRRTHAAASVVRFSSGSDHSLEKLHDAARHLVRGIEAHLRLEEHLLAPALAVRPHDGASFVARMVAGHRRQLQEVDALVKALGQREQRVEALPERLDEIVSRFESDLAREEGLLLALDPGEANVEAPTPS
jgi:CBS domain-containing protein